ncbi:hypothetical protein HNP48_002245 [Acidovorax soli]|uniref:Uncharacterized protein n=1 Tax=Acidovorax soli TaxID=592050 RepID=A0A7X0PCV2_9BURK|nr:hypothetical protein [Acidovorax soli]MBB6559578.1 hypothetical protein [Acidovorax soli]
MHQPRPHGSFGTEAATEEDAAAAELLARRLTNFKASSGLDSLKLTRTLPSGAMAIAVDMGGVLRVIIQQRKEPDRPDIETDGMAKSYIPMLFSGSISNGIIRGGEGVRIKLTSTTRRRLVSYDTEAAQPPSDVSLQRFVIEHNGRVSELRPKKPTSATWTQYANQRPTWYSGAMAQVMQVVGGYGRQALKELPDNKIERARLVLPASVTRKIELELGNTRLPGYLGLPPKSGEFQYDYKHNETNGVGFDGRGKPWLLRVSTRGVYAMPLPIIPATSTRAFREYMTEVGDEEVLWILDRFGGMPSGENFPLKSSDFESWRRAGVIIKVCDAGDFYNHLAYTSAIGWSFNSWGTEGYNTCYDYDEGGIGFGLTFKLRLGLAVAENDGKLPDSFNVSDPQEMQRLNRYMSMLYEQLPGNTPRELAIKYKLRRVPVSEVLARVNNSGPGEVDHWDNLEAKPIAAHGGNIAEVGRGWLYHPARPRSQPQIKFPEPFMDGCVSHDFGRLENHPAPGVVRCNTTMFVYYVGDQVKAANYFYDPRGYSRDVENNYEECMIVGSWEQTVTTGSTTLWGHFYTSDFDELEAAAPVTTVTQTVGTDLSYDTKPNFSFDHVFAMCGSIWRNRYFQHKVKESTTEGFSKSVAVCIPYLTRNALLYAHKQSTSGARVTESLGVYAISDPNTYRYFTYDFVWAWVGGLHGGNITSIEKVSPYPIHGNPVWVTGYSYGPYPCSDFADQGDWIGGLPQDYTWLVHPVRSEWQHSGGGGPPKVKEYSRDKTEEAKKEALLQISVLEFPQEVHKDPSEGYFTVSPLDGVAFYVDAIRNVAGDATYANTSEPDPEAPKQRKRFGFSGLADHKAAHHFIGVIHG